MTDFGQIGNYADYIAKDPFRMGMHYPAVLKELGDLKKRILDVGTGDGLFPRELLAPRGASVVAYDISAGKIAEAKAHEDASRVNVKYLVATPQTFSDDRPFDDATSIMVLPYAENIDTLNAFFSSTNSHLASGGKFVSIILNPFFSAFETNLIVRRIKKLDGNNVQMLFLNEATGDVEMKPIMHQYTKEEYERAATQAGMNYEWKKMSPIPEAVAQKGESFWQPCLKHEPYALFIARKE